MGFYTHIKITCIILYLPSMNATFYYYFPDLFVWCGWGFFAVFFTLWTLLHNKTLTCWWWLMCLCSAWVKPFTLVFSTHLPKRRRCVERMPPFLYHISEMLSLINGHSCQHCELLSKLFNVQWNAKLSGFDLVSLLQFPTCENMSLQFSHSFSKHKLWVKTCRSPAFIRAMGKM